MFGFAQESLLAILGVVAFIVEIVAFIDSLKYSNGEYRMADKRTKAFWTTMTGASSAIGFITLPPPVGRGSGVLSLLGLVAVVAAGVFLTDVKPALRSVRGRSSKFPRGGW